MRGGIDKVGERDQGGGEADSGAIECGDEDFGVGVERVGDVDVVGDKSFEPVAARVFVCGLGVADGDVGTCRKESAFPS